MTNVTGEKRVSTKGVAAEKSSFPTLPTGDYELKLIGDQSSIGAPAQKNPTSVPYVKTRFEVLGSATKEGGKNLLLFPMFNVRNYPDSSGKIPWARAGGINGLSKSFGEDADFPVLDFTRADGETVEILDPQAVVQWLKDHDGLTVKAHVKLRKATKGEEDYGDKNEIAYFILDTE